MLIGLSLAALCLSACFSYIPTDPSRLGTGARVRVRLQEPQSVPLRNLTANDIVAARGEITVVRDNEIVLSALALESALGREYAAEWETVTLPRERLAAVERREFSWIRTAGLALVAVAASVLTSEVIDTGGGGDRGAPPPPQPK